MKESLSQSRVRFAERDFIADREAMSEEEAVVGFAGQWIEELLAA